MLNMIQRPRKRGQAMVELALVLPLFLMVIFGIITLGLGVFYQQQVTNAAREAARYATTHSATDDTCPTVSNLPTDPTKLLIYYECDAPSDRWPKMTAHAQSAVFGLDRTSLRVTACWSGYWSKNSDGTWAEHDDSPVDPAPPNLPNEFRNCTLPSINPDTGTPENVDPQTMTTVPGGAPTRLGCSNPLPLTTAANDMASSFSKSNGASANEVTVYVCYAWQPPLAGFLLIPSEVILRGVVTEAMEYQQ
jgi:hypothetical protein